MSLSTNLTVEGEITSVTLTDKEKENVLERLTFLLNHLFSKNSFDMNEYFQSKLVSNSLLLDTILEYPQVVEISTDVDLIIRALKLVHNIVLSENIIHIKTEQHTIILRDISSNIPLEEISKIFRSDIEFPVVKGIRSDMNNTWFVTFGSEEEARQTLFLLRKCKFENKPILARLKTESVAKSYFKPNIEINPNPATAVFRNPPMINVSPLANNINQPGFPSPVSSPLNPIYHQFPYGVYGPVPSPIGTNPNGSPIYPLPLPMWGGLPPYPMMTFPSYPGIHPNSGIPFSRTHSNGSSNGNRSPGNKNRQRGNQQLLHNGAPKSNPNLSDEVQNSESILENPDINSPSLSDLPKKVIQNTNRKKKTFHESDDLERNGEYLDSANSKFGNIQSKSSKNGTKPYQNRSQNISIKSKPNVEFNLEMDFPALEINSTSTDSPNQHPNLSSGSFWAAAVIGSKAVNPSQVPLIPTSPIEKPLVSLEGLVNPTSTDIVNEPQQKTGKVDSKQFSKGNRKNKKKIDINQSKAKDSMTINSLPTGLEEISIKNKTITQDESDIISIEPPVHMNTPIVINDVVIEQQPVVNHDNSDNNSKVWSAKRTFVDVVLKSSK